MSRVTQPATHEHETRGLPGFAMLFFNVLWIIAAVALMVSSAVKAELHPGQMPWGIPLGVLGIALGFIAFFGYFSLQPNQARVQILFGTYKGTVRRSGFHWANPFYSRGRGGSSRGSLENKVAPLSQRDIDRSIRAGLNPANSTKLSLRANNFNSETLKVNDKRGNPVEIAAVVVWRVHDTAQAVFDVEDYKSYVQVQSEAAIRGIASRFAYDHGEQHEPTLRGSADEVALALQEELQARLSKAGVVVEEARLTHLAYAPEIASVMLRRQQAEAIVAARQLIVQGSVGMVQAALAELEKQNVVKLDEERRASMVSNLLVVLCGNSEATPVINAGTLYG
ncbi:MAG TPA: SPFH domain-containing protein [Steroidobacteraceae bacterium]|nr:SPFH domain-containing protein [Steroidobacteraceae bacterium]